MAATVCTVRSLFVAAPRVSIDFAPIPVASSEGTNSARKVALLLELLLGLPTALELLLELPLELPPLLLPIQGLSLPPRVWVTAAGAKGKYLALGLDCLARGREVRFNASNTAWLS